MTMHFKVKTIDSVLVSLTLNSVYRDGFTELAKLAAAALVIPMSTADGVFCHDKNGPTQLTQN